MSEVTHATPVGYTTPPVSLPVLPWLISLECCCPGWNVLRVRWPGRRGSVSRRRGPWSGPRRHHLLSFLATEPSIISAPTFLRSRSVRGPVRGPRCFQHGICIREPSVNAAIRDGSLPGRSSIAQPIARAGRRRTGQCRSPALRSSPRWASSTTTTTVGASLSGAGRGRSALSPSAEFGQLGNPPRCPACPSLDRILQRRPAAFHRLSAEPACGGQPRVHRRSHRPLLHHAGHLDRRCRHRRCSSAAGSRVDRAARAPRGCGRSYLLVTWPAGAAAELLQVPTDFPATVLYEFQQRV